MTRDPFEALEALIALGVDRVLTSGQEESALEGLDLLRDLVARAGDRITVMVCGNLTEKNIDRVAQEDEGEGAPHHGLRRRRERHDLPESAGVYGRASEAPGVHAFGHVFRTNLKPRAPRDDMMLRRSFSRRSPSGWTWIPRSCRGGHEPDDGLALLQAFHSPELEVRGVSVVYGNSPLETGYPIAQEIARRFGPSGLPGPPRRLERRGARRRDRRLAGARGSAETRRADHPGSRARDERRDRAEESSRSRRARTPDRRGRRTAARTEVRPRRGRNASHGLQLRARPRGFPRASRLRRAPDRSRPSRSRRRRRSPRTTSSASRARPRSRTSSSSLSATTSTGTRTASACARSFPSTPSPSPR